MGSTLKLLVLILIIFYFLFFFSTTDLTGETQAVLLLYLFFLQLYFPLHIHTGSVYGDCTVQMTDQYEDS